MQGIEATATPRDRYKTLNQMVAEQLTDDIVAGHLPPGKKLSEPELAAEYGVSRGPVREALRLLEGNGLVQIVAGKGATVTKLTSAEIVEAYAIRAELESLGARIGVRSIDQATLDEMGVALRRMGESVESPADWIKANDEFHLLLYRASGMWQLCEIVSGLMIKARPYRFAHLTPRETLVAAHTRHIPLYEAICRGDAAVAEKLTRAELTRAQAAVGGTAVPDDEADAA
jgi:DNA-binding GntR family transcriptional regulator